jgi:hypothetical protein
MNYGIFDAEAEDLDLYEDEDFDDPYGEGDVGGYYDYESEEAGGGWGWPDERGAYEMAYEEEWPQGMDAHEAGLYEDATLMAEGLREVLHEDYQDLPAEEMEEVLFDMLDSLPPEAEWSIGGALKSIGQKSLGVLSDPTVSSLSGKVLPIAGGAVGTYFGGPAGTTMGASLGSKLAGLLPTRRKQGKAAAKLAKGSAKLAKGSAKNGSAAAAQLLSLLQNDKMLKGVLSLALGQNGRKAVKLGTGQSSVDVSALMSLAKNLFEEAAADADELARESDFRPRYLLDSEGEYAYDPVDPGERDQALYEALIDAEEQGLMESGEGPYAPWEAEVPAEAWPPRWWQRRQAQRWEQRRRWAQQARRDDRRSYEWDDYYG